MIKVSDILQEELEALQATISENMRQAGQVASGRTLASMRVEVEDLHGALRGGLPEGAPIGTFETGRKAGRVPAGFRGIIRQWMEDKGIKGQPIPYVRQPSERWQPKYDPQERGNQALAGAIAHKIETEGTRLYRAGGRNDIYSPAIQQTITNIQSRIKKEMLAEIQSINLHL